MLGLVVNTHHAWLARTLGDTGYRITRQTAVADSAAAISQVVREALTRAEFVIVTGGLGPTSDDITRDEIAKLIQRPLREDPAILRDIEQFFNGRGRPMPRAARVQAAAPEGAIVFPNAFGTAPGLAMEIRPGLFRANPGWLILLPGPPRELRPMVINQMIPLLREKFPPEPLCVRTLKSTGIGESIVEERIALPLKKCVEAGLEIGYCARPGEVDVRLAATGPDAARLVDRAEEIVRKILGHSIYTTGAERIEDTVVRLLAQQKRTLAMAESCTGGHIANRITDVPGASAVFLGGFVTYSNAAKQSFLGVRQETLEAYGAVSEATAKEMCEGARRRSGADFALATTGIAGPSGGTPEKPLGTVYVAMAGPEGTVAEHRVNPFDRETFKHVTSQQALDLLRRVLSEETKNPQADRTCGC